MGGFGGVRYELERAIIGRRCFAGPPRPFEQISPHRVEEVIGVERQRVDDGQGHQRTIQLSDGARPVQCHD